MLNESACTGEMIREQQVTLLHPLRCEAAMSGFLDTSAHRRFIA